MTLNDQSFLVLGPDTAEEIHKGCGGQVTRFLDHDLLGDGSGVWAEMPVCQIHGGPIVGREIIMPVAGD